MSHKFHISNLMKSHLISIKGSYTVKIACIIKYNQNIKAERGEI